jgi:hypothetical protein
MGRGVEADRGGGAIGRGLISSRFPQNVVKDRISAT